MENIQENKIPVKAWLLLITMGIIWGSSYFLMSKGLEVFSATQVASLRLGISCAAFLPIFIYRFKEIPWKKTHFLLVVGALGSGVPASCFALAQTKLTSSITGVLGSTTPLFTLIVAILFFGLIARKWQIIGVLVGLLGALFIALYGAEEVLGDTPWYAVLPMLATVCYAFSTNTVKSKLQDVHPLTISSAAFVIIAPVVWVVLFGSGIVNTMQTEPDAWEAFAYVAVLSILGTFLGAIFFFTLIQITSAVFASTVAYMIPLVATIIGFFRGEPITFIHIIGLSLILCGVWLTRRK